VSSPLYLNTKSQNQVFNQGLEGGENRSGDDEAEANDSTPTNLYSLFFSDRFLYPNNSSDPLKLAKDRIVLLLFFKSFIQPKVRKDQNQAY
jgi:hypothetical protein